MLILRVSVRLGGWNGRCAHHLRILVWRNFLPVWRTRLWKIEETWRTVFCSRTGNLRIL